jgi:hypothetical protein
MVEQGSEFGGNFKCFSMINCKAKSLNYCLMNTIKMQIFALEFDKVMQTDSNLHSMPDDVVPRI